MSFPVVKVRKSEFRRFLLDSADVAILWTPENIAFEEFARAPYEVDELMTAIDLFALHECAYVYIFNANVENPQTEWENVTYDDEKLPEVTANELPKYIPKTVGNDFLYFACTLEEASSVSYTTLVPGRSTDRHSPAD